MCNQEYSGQLDVDGNEVNLYLSVKRLTASAN